MTKSLDGAVVTEVAKEENAPFFAIEIYATSGTQRYCLLGGSVNWNGNPYTAIDGKMGDVTWDQDLRMPSLTFELQNVTLEFSQLLLTDQEEVRGVEVKIFKLFQGLLTNAAAYDPYFDGAVRDWELNGSKWTVTLDPWFTTLEDDVAARSCGRDCEWPFGSTECTITPTEAVDGVVEAGSTTSNIVDATHRVEAAGTWTHGYVQFLTGVNSTSGKRKITTYTGGALPLEFPFPSTPGVGDTYSVKQGCNNDTTDCRRYNNLANYEGNLAVPKQAAT